MERRCAKGTAATLIGREFTRDKSNEVERDPATAESIPMRVRALIVVAVVT